MPIKKFGKEQKTHKIRTVVKEDYVNKFVDDKTLVPPDKQQLKEMYTEHIRGQREPFKMIKKKCDICREEVEVNPALIVGKSEFWRCDDCIKSAVKGRVSR